MKILALDTSTRTASVAVVHDGRLLASVEDQVSTHSEKLVLLVDLALRQAELRLSDLDAIACGMGPGSFTGLRIGLSTAKAFCFALAKPLLPVSSLAALARGADVHGLILAILHAKRDELYAGLYQVGKTGIELAVAEAALPASALLEYVGDRQNVIVVGDGCAAQPKEAADVGNVIADARSTPNAVHIAELALRAVPITGDALLALAPSYVRTSTAERNRGPDGGYRP